MSRPPVLNLGLIGLTPEWETRYAPAIARLEKRVHVARVFDPRPARADQVAVDVQARACHGIRSLLKSPGLNGLLLLDFGWHPHWGLTTAVASGQPIFLGQDHLRSLADWTALPAALTAAETVVIPECLLRYQPSMLRLRELMATQLGPIEHVSFVLQRARRTLDARLCLREVCNWFRTTFEVVTSRVVVEVSHAGRQGRSEIVLHGPTRTGRSISLGLLSVGAVPADDERKTVDEQYPFCTVDSESGRVEIFGPRQLRWQLQGDPVAETLDADRSATDVALDLFARRAIGGLPPVPDLTHLDHAQRLANAVAATFPGEII